MKQVQVSSKCDAKSEDYLATSIRECQKSTFICTEEKERFDNDCGCGCREKKNEEKAMACTRDQQCGRFGSCLDAHKDDCHPLCGGQNCKKQCYVESKQVCGGDLPMQCKDGMICVDDPSDTCHSGCQMKPMSVGEDPVAKESDPLIYPPPPIADCPGKYSFGPICALFAYAGLSLLSKHLYSHVPHTQIIRSHRYMICMHRYLCSPADQGCFLQEESRCRLCESRSARVRTNQVLL